MAMPAQHARSKDGWAEILAASSDPRERAVAATIAEDATLLSELSVDAERIVRAHVATNSSCPESVRAQLQSDGDLLVRLKALAPRAGEALTAESAVACVNNWVRDRGGFRSFAELEAAIR